MTNPIRVLVADDSPLLRRGIRVMLDSANDVKLVGEAKNGREAIALVEDLAPDVVIMDVSMPELNGLKATEQLQSMEVDTRILILSMHNNPTFVRQALRAGARGYVLKRSLAKELLSAVYRVNEGELYLSQIIEDGAGGNGSGGSSSRE